MIKQLPKIRVMPVEMKKEAKTVLIEFGENTTAHGVPRVTKARTFRGYVFWITVCLICVILFLFQAIFLIQRFLRYETTTQIEVSDTCHTAYGSSECRRIFFPAEIRTCGISSHYHLQYKSLQVQPGSKRGLTATNGEPTPAS